MTRRNLTPAEEDALEDLFHNCDLIHTRPLPCEIEWALARARENTPLGRY